MKRGESGLSDDSIHPSEATSDLFSAELRPAPGRASEAPARREHASLRVRAGLQARAGGLFHLALSLGIFAFAGAMLPGCTQLTPGESNSSAEQGRVLEPLPEPPVIQVEQEDDPGKSPNLEVVVMRPTGEVGGNVRPTITFNRPIIAMDMIDRLSKLPPPADISPALSGTWRWIGSSSVEFVPSGLMPYATTFTVTVKAGLKALDGKELKAPVSFSFNTPRPSIEISPVAGYRWVSPDQLFILNANQKLQNLEGQLQFVFKDKPAIPAKVVKVVDVAAEERARRKKRAGSVEPMSDDEKGFKDRRTRYEVTAASPLPLNTAFTLEIAPTLKGEEGSLPVEEAKRIDYQTYGPMRFTKARGCHYYEWMKDECPDGRCPCVYGPLVLYTSNPIDVKTLKDRVTIQPAVKINWEDIELPEDWDSDDQGPTITIPGSFSPGTRYKIRIGSGVKDAFGQEGTAFMADMVTDNAEPSLSIDSDNALIEANGDGVLPVQAVNLKSVEADVWSLTPADMARALKDSKYRPPFPSSRLTLDVVASRNQPRYFPLDLRKISPQPKKNGLFMAFVRSPEVPETILGPVLAQVTDLAVHAKVGAAKGVAWVTRLSTGKPEAGVRVELFDETGSKRWIGTTGKDGAVEFPGVAGLFEEENEWATPFVLISATKDNDVSVTLSTWDGMFWPGSMGVDTDNLTQNPNALGVVLAERGIYRPGDDVYLKGVVRYRRLKELISPPAGQKVKVKVIDSKDQNVVEADIALTRYGTWSHQFKLPKDAPLGYFRVEVTAQADKGEELTYYEGFRVEEFRTPQFVVDVNSTKEEVTAGAEISADVTARYLFGGAMTGARVTWTATRSTSEFMPPDNKGFEFGMHAWWWDDSDPMPSYETFASGEGEADAQGTYRIKPGVADAPGERPWEYTLEADVEDVSRQRFADRATVLVHPAAAYAGVKTSSDGFARANSPANLELVAAAPDGKRLAGQKLAVEIKLREWKNIRKREAGNQWITQSEVVETRAAGCELVSAAQPVICSFTPTRPGFYLVEATLVDGEGRKQITRTSMYVVGDGWVSWQRDDDSQVEMVPDKALYDVGETAKILVKNPYPEAQALVSVEREGVISHSVRVLKNAAETIEVPIDDSMLPNVFVSVVVVRGRVPDKDGMESGDDPGRPVVRVGYATLNVEKKSKKLELAISTDAPDYRPRGKVKVNLKVTDYLGKGAKSEVTLWAVDEGVLRLTEYELPNPVELIHPNRGLRVRVAESLINLVQKRKFGAVDKGFSSGGSGGMDAAGSDMRSQFRTTAVFLPEVETDENGMATLEFTLPDNLTTFRLMGLAVNGVERFGTGENKITVSKPLLINPALPRLTRVGDSFEAGVVVNVKNPAIKTVNVTASAEGLLLEGKKTSVVSMGDGRAKEVRFLFKAQNAGTATLRFMAESGEEKDGLELKLPVQLPVSMEAVAVYGQVSGAEKELSVAEAIVPPSGILPAQGGLNLSLSSSLLGGFDEGMRQLIDYPYGCLEQLSSRLVPFVALRELFGKFGVKYPTEQMAKREKERLMVGWLGQDALQFAGSGDPDAVVAKTITKIQSLQTYDGGYRYWSSSLCASDFGSAYAVLALGRAKELGYAVDEEAFKRGQTWLADTVAAGQKAPCSYSVSKPDDVTRVFALYTLARTGEPRPNLYAELYGRRAKLPLFGKAMLADAMFVGKGDRKQAKALLTEILNLAQETPGEVHFAEKNADSYAIYWSSDTRTSALVLQTLASIQPDHPFVNKIARHLAQVRGVNGRFRNTQEAAFGLMALADVVRIKEKETPNFEARVLLGGQSLAQASFTDRSLKVERTAVPIDTLAAGAASGSAGGAGSTGTGTGGTDTTNQNNAKSLTFSRTGAGNLYYSALLRYAPVELPTTPQDRGMIVQRWFEPFAGGGQTRTFDAGELVRVRVRVASPAERHFVAVEVPLPSGLEIVDTSLASTASLTRNVENEGMGQSYEWEGEGEGEGEGEESEFNLWDVGFYSPFNHVEQRDDRVLLYSDELPPGVHVSTFVARATTPGDFVLKPARAEEMYTPEVYGRSEGGRFKVRPGRSMARK